MKFSIYVLTQQPNDQLRAARLQGENKRTKSVKEERRAQDKREAKYNS